jgi:diguanylate cyclase (GGDEF)-like protein
VAKASGAPPGDSPSDREELAKTWLLRLIERTDLKDVGELSLRWIATEAPPLIADILAGLSDPEAAPNGDLPGTERERLAKVARLRDGPGAAELIPRDLATLQTLLIESLRRDVPESKPGDFAAAVSRLAETFGTIQGAVTRDLVDRRSGGAGQDPLTGLPGPSHLDEWLRILLAEHRRYEHPFSLALIDVDGLSKINDAYGDEAGDGMLTAVAGVINRQLDAVDQAFRVGDDEFCVLAPHQDSAQLVPMATQLAELIANSQLDEGPRLAVAIGIASCPQDGSSAEELVEAAEQASYAAKAASEPVVTSASRDADSVQDR